MLFDMFIFWKGKVFGFMFTLSFFNIEIWLYFWKLKVIIHLKINYDIVFKWIILAFSN